MSWRIVLISSHHIGVYEQMALELSQSGSLPVRGARSGSDALAQKVRRVRMKTLESGRVRMRVAEQALWESSFPGIWQRCVHPRRRTAPGGAET